MASSEPLLAAHNSSASADAHSEVVADVGAGARQRRHIAFAPPTESSFASASVASGSPSLADPAGQRRLIHVQVDDTQEFRSIAIYDGMVRDDIAACLRTIAGLNDDEDIVLVDAVDGCMVPLSAALPAGIRLKLECSAANGDSGRDDDSEPPRAHRVDDASAAQAAHGPLPLRRVAVESSGGDSTKSGGSPTNPSSQASKDHLFTRQMSKQMADNTEAMKMFNKISNYLANDRTFLAWTRTSLALVRTTFAIAGLQAISTGWSTALSAVNLSLSVLCFMVFITGVIRFIDVRSALDSSQPPKFMLDRVAGVGSSRWTIRRVSTTAVVMGATIFVIALAAGTKRFVKM
mmetsp:Transcript_39101/g.112383  ORF Transcript_39101/g.112383 Transcript_39101/m.112383 type:complete len:348 (+) Transcript_39101:55-1098(+)